MREPGRDTETTREQLDSALAKDRESDGERQASTRRRSPTEKKTLAYRLDHRLGVQDPHRHRRAWPKKKALRNQTYRRQVSRSLEPALGPVASEIDDFSPDAVRRRKSKWTLFGGPKPLGKWVKSQQRKRLSHIGRKLRANFDRERYRNRLPALLANLIEGRSEHSRELARFFSLLLELPPAGYPWGWEGNEEKKQFPGVVDWIDWHHRLRALFREQPEWEAKLRSWIASFGERKGNGPRDPHTGTGRRRPRKPGAGPRKAR